MVGDAVGFKEGIIVGPDVGDWDGIIVGIVGMYVGAAVGVAQHGQNRRYDVVRAGAAHVVDGLLILK